VAETAASKYPGRQPTPAARRRRGRQSTPAANRRQPAASRFPKRARQLSSAVFVQRPGAEPYAGRYKAGETLDLLSFAVTFG
jgi:hypothetical protein